MPAAATPYFDMPDEPTQRLPHAPQNLENDFSYEVSHLESMVSKGLKNLQHTCAQMQQVEQELRCFLDEYYAQVGHFFAQLETLKREIAEQDRKIHQARHKRSRALAQLRGESAEVVAILREELPAVPLDMRHDDWDAEMKAIYHRLVKLYHPDVAATGACSTRVLQLINQAYEKRNLWAMREMEHSLVEHALARYDTPATKLARLRERYEAIAHSITAAVERRNRLQRSEAWQLKQRMERDRYLLEVIIHRVKKQIEEARRILTLKHIEYKAAIF